MQLQHKKDRTNHFKEIYEQLENNKDTRGTYNLLKNQAGWRAPGPPTTFLVDGKLEKSPQKLAELQMTYFHEKISKLQSQLPQNNIDPL